MPLTLLVGPASSGRVACLLDRYLADLGRDPVLIVPGRADVEEVERDLLRRRGALLGGSIGTFDDLVAHVAEGDGPRRPLLAESQRRLVLRAAAREVRLGELARSARFAGFLDALAETLSELEAALLDPDDVPGELADLHRAYRAQLERLALWDRDRQRRHAVARLQRDLQAWDGRPVYVYAWEGLTAAERAVLEALAARSQVTVSLPYEPGRAAFAALAGTAGDLARLAGGNVEELSPLSEGYRHPALFYLERSLFQEEATPAPPPLAGAVRFLEGAGARGAIELVADEVLALLREGVPAEEIAVICPGLDRFRLPIEAVFSSFSLPYAFDGHIRLAQTPFGHALLGLLRFAWLGGGRADLYAFLRSPYSGLRRDHVDFLEGRLRGRAVRSPGAVEEETARLRGRPLPALEALRTAPSPAQAARWLALAMAGNAYGLSAPPTASAAVLDLRACEAAVATARELEGWLELGGAVAAEDVVAALERAPVRLGRAGETGRVAVLDLARARTQRYEAVFILGLEEGGLPRRAAPAGLLDEAARLRLQGGQRGARVGGADLIARERYLFYAACTRARRRLYLVREAASDEGAPRQPSPFWEDVQALFAPDDVARWTRRRPLGELTWPLERAPSERERLRAACALAAVDPAAARSLARANGWERRLERALSAFQRSTRLTNPSVLAELGGRASFSVTELEVFADCSSLWLVERLLDPRCIDGRVDARLRGQIAHQALFRFFSGLPRRLRAEQVSADGLQEALAYLEECLQEALAGYLDGRLELTEAERLELEGSLRRDLEQFVRAEAQAASSLVPRRFEVSFGSERSAPELRRGLDLGGFVVSGKIDRIDLDPFSARGIVQDYKSGSTAPAAREIASERRLQLPLYMLVLRDLVGVEPLGGLYRALSGERQARGLLRAEAREALPGLPSRDYLEEEEFWAVVEQAAESARGFVARIRAGDVRHDPKGGFPCPSWCDRWPICRVGRP
jgi:ATP-dependent helicase/DNAse subunit B